MRCLNSTPPSGQLMAAPDSTLVNYYPYYEGDVRTRLIRNAPPKSRRRRRVRFTMNRPPLS